MNAPKFTDLQPIETHPEENQSLKDQITERVEEEKKQFAPNDYTPLKTNYPPLKPTQTKVNGRLTQEPPPPESILTYNNNPLLIRKTVGAIVAAGGTGKTFLLSQLAYAMADGSNLGPLQAANKFNVLLLVGEDPEDELNRRLWKIGSGHFPDRLHAYSVTGKVGPLMSLNQNNPIKSEWFDWLDTTISNHPNLDVLILDPKSRFYGLEENNNDHAVQWVAMLESLSIKHGLTILFTHHVSKNLAQTMDQAMSRGASALVDSCRWVVGLTGVSESTAKRYDIDPRGYIEFDIVKSNYAQKLPKSLFFKRELNGVFKYSPLEVDRLQKMAEFLCDILNGEEEKFSRRELRLQAEANHISDQMSGEFPNFKRRKEMDIIIDFCLESRRMREIEDAENPNNKKKVLEVLSENLVIR